MLGFVCTRVAHALAVKVVEEVHGVEEGGCGVGLEHALVQLLELWGGGGVD